MKNWIIIVAIAILAFIILSWIHNSYPIEFEHTYKIYCINHNNPERKERMTQRFLKLHLPYQFTTTGESCMISHLRALEEFLVDDEAEFGIICEDDIYIRRSFAQDVKKLLSFMANHEALELMLVGYLLPPSIHLYTHPLFNLKYPVGSKTIYPFKLYSYPVDLWGTQMYIVSKASTSSILDMTRKQRCEYLDVPFASDWNITKFPNCVLAYPLLAVEEGELQKPDPSGSHTVFHRACTQKHYDPRFYL